MMLQEQTACRRSNGTFGRGNKIGNRFRSGQSGNPLGRRPERPLTEALRDALDANDGALIRELVQVALAQDDVGPAPARGRHAPGQTDAAAEQACGASQPPPRPLGRRAHEAGTKAAQPLVFHRREGSVAPPPRTVTCGALAPRVDSPRARRRKRDELDQQLERSSSAPRAGSADAPPVWPRPVGRTPPDRRGRHMLVG